VLITAQAVVATPIVLSTSVSAAALAGGTVGEGITVAADGSLDTDLLANSLPNFDMKQFELLVSDPSQLGKILDEAPETIIARTADPIPTPDGRWLRVYALADGSVQQKSTDDPDEAFDGNWHLGQVKPRP